MNITDLRMNLQASSTARRIAERRKNPYTFGTPEWLEYMQNQGLESPTQDRRGNTDKRSTADRRQRDDDKVIYEKPYVRILLTPAEKKLIEDVYLTDFD